MNKKLYENIIKGIKKGIRQSLNEDIYSSVSDNSLNAVIENIIELCYEADTNHIHSILGLDSKYWDIAETVIGNSKKYGEIWGVQWNSNMNGHYKSRVNCKDISEYTLYSIAITYKDSSNHTYTLYFGEDYVKPEYKAFYKTQLMDKKDIYVFLKYMKQLIYEGLNYLGLSKQSEKQEEDKLNAWKEKMISLIYAYANKKLARTNITVKKLFGSTLAEGDLKYEAITFYKNKYSYIGRIKVNYNELDLSVPLCGHNFMKLTEENYKDLVDYCIDFMLN